MRVTLLSGRIAPHCPISPEPDYGIHFAIVISIKYWKSWIAKCELFFFAARAHLHKWIHLSIMWTLQLLRGYGCGIRTLGGMAKQSRKVGKQRHGQIMIWNVTSSQRRPHHIHIFVESEIPLSLSLVETPNHLWDVNRFPNGSMFFFLNCPFPWPHGAITRLVIQALEAESSPNVKSWIEGQPYWCARDFRAAWTTHVIAACSTYLLSRS
jgi:hypothetical protein